MLSDLGAELVQTFSLSLMIFFFFWGRSSGILSPWRPCRHKVYHCVAVASYTVISGNELDKVVVGGSASPSLKGEGIGISVIGHRRQRGPQLSPGCALMPTSLSSQCI